MAGKWKTAGEWQNVALAAVTDAVLKGLPEAFKEVSGGVEMPGDFKAWNFKKQYGVGFAYGFEKGEVRAVVEAAEAEAAKAAAKTARKAPAAGGDYQYDETPEGKWRWRAGMEAWELFEPAAVAEEAPERPSTKAQEAPAKPSAKMAGQHVSNAAAINAARRATRKAG